MSRARERLARLNRVLKRGFRVEADRGNFLAYKVLDVNGLKLAGKRELIGQAGNIDAAWQMMLAANGVEFSKLAPGYIIGSRFRM